MRRHGSFTPPLVIKLRDRVAEQSGRCAAEKLKSTLSVLFAWGRERGFIADNPADKIKALKRPKDMPQPNRPWADAERETVLAALPAHMLLPFTLMMYCGLDPIDVVSLPRTAIKDGLIDTKRNTAITVCANSRGRPWTVQGFSSSRQAIKQRLLAEGAIGEGLTLRLAPYSSGHKPRWAMMTARLLTHSASAPLSWRSTIPIGPIVPENSPQW